MKYKTIFKVFVVFILLILIGFSIQKLATLRVDIDFNDFGYSETIKHPTVVEIDTLVVIHTIYDTVFAKAKKEYIKNDSTGVVDSLLIHKWEPSLDHLSGYVDISCNVNNESFFIVSNLEVKENTVTVTVDRPVIIPHPWFRTSVALGAFGSKENGILLIGGGIVIKNKLGLYPAALSNEMIGGFFIYNF